MRIKVDIVQGFLGSGKTLYINNELLPRIKEERVLVVQEEEGNTTLKNKNTFIANRENLDEKINLYKPDRIIIEKNSFNSLETLRNALDGISSNKFYFRVISILDCNKFKVYHRNMRDLAEEQIANGDLIIINNFKDKNGSKEKWIRKKIKNINDSAQILIEKNKIYKDVNKGILGTIIQSLILILILIFIYLFVNINEKLEINRLLINFISIVIEGIPFILLGSLVSSIIQVTLNEEKIEKFISDNSLFSCIVAAISGVFFPICDCGTIPIVRGLIKKNVPIAPAVTFMLASPIVNPISIMATLYAFPNNYILALYRVLVGMLIAITVGVIIQILSQKSKNILKAEDDIINCDCALCEIQGKRENKLKVIITSMTEEFFKVGKFMIIGGFISSIIQNLFTVSGMHSFSNKPIIMILIMILVGFFLSICSTSDAFIAKGLVNEFPLYSVMGFLIVGPMLDIKNTIMLFANFKGKFVIKLMIVILVVSLSYLYIFSLI